MYSAGSRRDTTGLSPWRFTKTGFDKHKIIFIFDCDAKKEYEACNKIKTDFIVPFIFDQNPNNQIEEIQSGIENLFDEGIFEDSLFDVTTVDKNGKVIKKTKELKKQSFLDHIKKNHADNNSFKNFKPLHNFIQNFL